MVDAPAWFRRALAVPFTDEHVEVGGARIHYLAWGEQGRPGLVFVHGGGAHAHWWTHLAATFADDFRVVALDLSGHGDSDHRDVYEIEQWTQEVVAVADAGGHRTGTRWSSATAWAASSPSPPPRSTPTASPA